MYASRTTQLIVGVFGLIGIAALVVLSIRLGNVSIFPPPGYVLFANFDNVSGLKGGAEVQMAGVPIGKVRNIWLHNDRARVSLDIHQGVQVDNDAIASIKTSGLLGDKYVAIAAGPGEKTLQNGDTIRQTEGSFILEDAIGQVINSIGSGGGSKDKDKDVKGGN